MSPHSRQADCSGWAQKQGDHDDNGSQDEEDRITLHIFQTITTTAKNPSKKLHPEGRAQSSAGKLLPNMNKALN